MARISLRGALLTSALAASLAPTASHAEAIGKVGDVFGIFRVLHVFYPDPELAEGEGTLPSLDSGHISTSR